MAKGNNSNQKNGKKPAAKSLKEKRLAKADKRKEKNTAGKVTF